MLTLLLAEPLRYLPMKTPSFDGPQLHEVPEPQALFLRPGPQDHIVLSQQISQGAPLTGVVFDPSFEKEHAELRTEVDDRGGWTVLDPKFLELSLSANNSARRLGLPWSDLATRTLQNFDEEVAQAVTAMIAKRAQSGGYSAVLAPTHFLKNGPSDRWFQKDLEMTELLRSNLNKIGLHEVPIFYPVCTPAKKFFNEFERARFKERLSQSSIKSLWLRVAGFGSRSGRGSLVNYIRACRDLQSLGLPIIPEKTGSIGLAILAFQSVSGLECGVSSGESFDVLSMQRGGGNNQKRAAHARVYFPDLGCSLPKKQAEDLLNAKAALGCKNARCCKQGIPDMLQANRRGHFLTQRFHEFNILSAPSAIRHSRYIDVILRKTVATLGVVSRIDNLSTGLSKRLRTEHRRTDGWLKTLEQNTDLHRFNDKDVPAFPRRIVGFRNTNVAK